MRAASLRPPGFMAHEYSLGPSEGGEEEGFFFVFFAGGGVR